MKLPVLSWLIMGAQLSQLWQIYRMTSQCVIMALPPQGRVLHIS